MESSNLLLPNSLFGVSNIGNGRAMGSQLGYIYAHCVEDVIPTGRSNSITHTSTQGLGHHWQCQFFSFSTNVVLTRRLSI